MNRRAFLGLFSTAGAVATAGCLGGRWEREDRAASPVEPGPSIGLEPVAEGLTQPLSIRFPTEDLRYIADKSGVLYLHDDDGLREEPLLDIRDRLLQEITSWEQGLVGMTIHPEFRQTRKLYVRYSAPLRDSFPSAFSHTFVLSEFRATEDLRQVAPDSERILLELPEPGKFHQAGGLAFGPDGYLYVTVGDGGSTPDSVFDGFRDSGPGHAEDWYLVNRGGNGQDVTENLLGSILRIDVDRREDGKPYSIPDDNPLVGEAGLDEHWAWGFRNPYTLSFDDDRLFVGDVGHQDYEEVNVVEKGGNYGWNVREGPMCYNANSGLRGHSRFLHLDSLPTCPKQTSDGDPLIDPVITYAHDRDGERVGSAVICGYVYRNDTVPALKDRYVFGDVVRGQTGGVVFVAEEAEEKPWAMRKVSISGSENGEVNAAVLSFGRDPDGELYLLTTRFAEGTGVVSKITDPD
jgi:glucose/arabinose dehydrogenase